MQKAKKVTLIGGGLAGLACAQILHSQDVKFTLVDSSERVGGRIKTEVLPSGLRIDRGFQVLLNSYPELPRFLNLDRLKLQNFGSGALIYQGKALTLLANPIRHPSRFLPTLFSSAVNFRDKLLVSKLVVRASFDHQTQLNISTLDFLKQFGFSLHFIDLFWKPFFTGIFLDPELSPDASFFLFLLRCFALGSVSVPSLGMEEIPKQMKSNLPPENFIFQAKVKTSQKEGVTLENGDQWESDFIVNAYPRFEGKAHSVTTYSFITSEKLNWGRFLVLIPPHFQMQINQLALMSEVARSYAPQGETLISASVVKSEISASIDDLKKEIEQVAGKSLGLTHVRTDAVPYALPYYPAVPTAYLRNGNEFFCGDYLNQPSINGALKSGRLTAEAILKQILI